MNSQVSFTLRGRNPDVLRCIANLSNDEVFTPPEFANRMLDTLAEAWAADNCGASIESIDRGEAHENHAYSFIHTDDIHALWFAGGKGTGDLLIYQNGGTGYVPSGSISTGSNFIDKWKVFIGEPSSISSETYLCIGPFDTKNQGEGDE